MKTYKIKILVFLCGMITLPQISQANQIFKCTDKTGSIFYHNNKSNTKGLNCTRTNLATIDKRKAPERVTSSNNTKTNSSTGNLSTEKISSYEQEIRNKKRLDLLRNELEQEKKQLLIISDMINKTSKKDEAQLKQLESIQTVHQNNINTLEKELKIDTTDFSKLKSTVIPGLGIIKQNDNNAPKFQIEGVDIDNVSVPTSLDKSQDNKSQEKKETNDKSNGLPSLELMQKNLKSLSNQRDGKQNEQDQSQHIQIKRREIPGMKVSQATLDYEPLPTPLSVPDFNIGK